MLNVARVLFVIVALINLTPLVGVLGAAQLASLYGQPVTDDDLLLLLRHRAVLFGLLGALLLAAAVRRELHAIATVAGLVSMGTFCFLAWPIVDLAAPIQRVFWIDVVAIPLLAAAWWLGRRAPC